MLTVLEHHSDGSQFWLERQTPKHKDRVEIYHQLAKKIRAQTEFMVCDVVLRDLGERLGFQWRRHVPHRGSEKGNDPGQQRIEGWWL